MICIASLGSSMRQVDYVTLINRKGMSVQTYAEVHAKAVMNYDMG